MTYRKNFSILLYDATVYSIFFTLWNVNTVIPVFLDHTGTPQWTIGLASAIKQLCFLIPQLIIAANLHRTSSLAGLIGKTIWIDRPQLLIFLVFLLFAGKIVAVAAFFVSFTIFCLGEGFINIPWMELMSRTVNPGSRGRLFGSVQVWSGLASLLAGCGISVILTNPAFPYPFQYLIIFGAGAVIMLPSLYLYGFVSEPIRFGANTNYCWKRPVVNGLQNRQFILLLFIQLFTTAANMAVPYYAVMVKHTFSLLYQSIGLYIFLNILGSILGGILWGYLSDRKGNRLTIISTALLGLISCLLFLISQFLNSEIFAKPLIGLGFLLAGTVSGGWLGFINYILEFAPFNERPLYLAVNNTAMLPAAMLPIAGGFIRAYRGDMFLYIITSMFAIFAFLASLKLKEQK